MLQGKEVFYFLLSRDKVREVIRDVQETESSVNLSKIALFPGSLPPPYRRSRVEPEKRMRRSPQVILTQR